MQVDSAERELRLHLIDDAGVPLPAQLVRLRIYQPHLNMECVTDREGGCVFLFSAEPDLIRGQLTIVGHGIRPVIWRGNSLHLPLELQADGLLDLPIDYALQSTTAAATPQSTQLITTPQSVSPAIEATAAASTPPSGLDNTKQQTSALSITPTTTRAGQHSAENQSLTLNTPLYLFISAISLFLFFAALWFALTYRGSKR